MSAALADTPVMQLNHNISGTFGLQFIGHKTGWIKQFRILTYALTPEEMYFPTLETTPNFILEAMPLVMMLMVLEGLVKWFIGKKDEVRLNNYVSSVSSTAVQDSFTQFFFRGLELTVYIWVYDNFRLTTLPWDSAYTYFFALLIVDYLAYWWHRGSHEIALFWAAHEFHHNSEDFNLSVALRLSYTMRLIKWMFYVPTAIMGLPVSTMWAHAQVGLVFNGFGHFSEIPPLGKVIPILGDIIEYIFVTPTHHKLHHAMNDYCLDKNYGNFLIVWDRLHGTFVDPKEGETLSFGTLTPITTTSVISLQNDPFTTFWNKVQAMETFGDKVRAVFYGPGWFPGTPRLGIQEELPDMRGRPRWDMRQPMWIKLYLLANCLAMFHIYALTANRAQDLSPAMHLLSFVVIYYGYWALGTIYDYGRYSAVFELIRLLGILGLLTLSSTPFIVKPAAAKMAVTIAILDLLLLPFVATNVYNRQRSGPSDQELYLKQLEKLNYVKPKFE